MAIGYQPSVTHCGITTMPTAHVRLNADS